MESLTNNFGPIEPGCRVILRKDSGGEGADEFKVIATEEVQGQKIAYLGNLNMTEAEMTDFQKIVWKAPKDGGDLPVPPGRFLDVTAHEFSELIRVKE